ncbi:fatty acyl-CoA reductase wat-like isoform X2 [Vespula maculifrons]|uniref:Fatty acyl-CoA reductase wat-like isoform X2 n=1 Tax=Vespula maculifrons TaxID=7453 RepID=A0ABD2B981_VESMC
MLKLKSFVYESLAYSNYANDPIEEKFYEPPIDADMLLDLMDSMDDKLIDDITLQFISSGFGVLL